MKTTTTVSAVDICIGGELRTYHAFVTTAPAAFDALGTISLHASTFAEVVALVEQPIPFDRALGQTPARLVLVGRQEFELQRALYREGRYLLAATDPHLVGETTLQRWLWQRLGAPPAYEVH